MFWRNEFVKNSLIMTAVSIVMLAGIAIYDLRFTHFGVPYDWHEICQSGYIRVGVEEGDTLFEQQIRAFAASKKLECSVIYCANDDQSWLELLMFRVDVIKTHDNPHLYEWQVRENSVDLSDTLGVWYDRNIRHISRYDNFFKQYADSVGWDWKLLAAIGYTESRFKNICCPSGLGIMQLSSVIARRFGAPGAKVRNPECNIRAAVGYIKFMDSKFNDIEDVNERQKFIIAAYNSGMKPVTSARSRARYAKKNPNLWDDVKPYYHNNHSKRYQEKILKKYEEYKIKS